MDADKHGDPFLFFFFCSEMAAVYSVLLGTDDAFKKLFWKKKYK